MRDHGVSNSLVTCATSKFHGDCISSSVLGCGHTHIRPSKSLSHSDLTNTLKVTHLIENHVGENTESSCSYANEATLKRTDSGQVASVSHSSDALHVAGCEHKSILSQVVAWWSQPAKLYTYQELPPHLRENIFVQTGYRAYCTYSECTRSIFQWHNESINIWCHWLGSLGFLALVFSALQWQHNHDSYTGISQITTATDRVMMAFYLFSAVLCLFCSGLFHTFHCHADKHVFDNMGIADYMGISLLISGSFVSFLYFAFRPHPELLPFPMAACVLSMTTGIILPWFAFFRSSKYRLLRTYIFMGIAGLLGFSVLWAMSQIWEEVLMAWQYSWLLWGIAVISSYVGGAFIYASRFPECFFPGRFDMVGASHQIWHILVIVGAVCHWRLLLQLRDWRVLESAGAYSL